MAGMINEKLHQPETMEQTIRSGCSYPFAVGAQQRQKRIKNRLKK